jgi:two-component system copper resistance phosphate regulon response regulator CusR
MSWVMGWWRGSLWQELTQWRVPLVAGPVALDVVGCRVLIEGRVVHLPAREAAILEVLMRHPGRVISVSELTGAIGEQADRGEQVARWVHRLARRLVISPLQAPLVESVPNAGYRYTPIASPGERQPDL